MAAISNAPKNDAVKKKKVRTAEELARRAERKAAKRARRALIEAATGVKGYGDMAQRGQGQVNVAADGQEHGQEQEVRIMDTTAIPPPDRAVHAEDPIQTITTPSPPLAARAAEAGPAEPLFPPIPSPSPSATARLSPPARPGTRSPITPALVPASQLAPPPMAIIQSLQAECNGWREVCEAIMDITSSSTSSSNEQTVHSTLKAYCSSTRRYIDKLEDDLMDMEDKANGVAGKGGRVAGGRQHMVCLRAFIEHRNAQLLQLQDAFERLQQQRHTCGTGSSSQNTLPLAPHTCILHPPEYFPPTNTEGYAFTYNSTAPPAMQSLQRAYNLCHNECAALRRRVAVLQDQLAMAKKANVVMVPGDFNIYTHPTYLQLKYQAEAGEATRLGVIKKQAEEIERLRSAERELQAAASSRGKEAGLCGEGGSSERRREEGLGRTTERAQPDMETLKQQLDQARRTIGEREELLVEFREEEKRLKGTIWDMKKELKRCKKQNKKASA